MQLIIEPDSGGNVAAPDAVGDGGAPDALTFCQRQSAITDPGRHATLLDGLPRDVPALCRVVRGLVLHPATAHLYGVRVPEARLRVPPVITSFAAADGWRAAREVALWTP